MTNRPTRRWTARLLVAPPHADPSGPLSEWVDVRQIAYDRRADVLDDALDDAAEWLEIAADAAVEIHLYRNGPDGPRPDDRYDAVFDRGRPRARYAGAASPAGTPTL